MKPIFHNKDIPIKDMQSFVIEQRFYGHTKTKLLSCYDVVAYVYVKVSISGSQLIKQQVAGFEKYSDALMFVEETLIKMAPPQLEEEKK